MQPFTWLAAARLPGARSCQVACWSLPPGCSPAHQRLQLRAQLTCRAGSITTLLLNNDPLAHPVAPPVFPQVAPVLASTTNAAVSDAKASIARNKFFGDECEAAINEQINIECEGCSPLVLAPGAWFPAPHVGVACWPRLAAACTPESAARHERPPSAVARAAKPGAKTTRIAFHPPVPPADNVSYVYHAMACFFDRDSVSLPGFAEYFRRESLEERSHAQVRPVQQQAILEAGHLAV